METAEMPVPASPDADLERITDAIGDGVDIEDFADETHGTVLTASDKCDHGVYIPAGETTAIYCGWCNPQTYRDSIILRTMARHRPLNRQYSDDREQDVARYIEQPVGARIAQATVYE